MIDPLMWFPDEVLTDAEIDAILTDRTPVDVLVSHDCPARLQTRIGGLTGVRGR